MKLYILFFEISNPRFNQLKDHFKIENVYNNQKFENHKDLWIKNLINDEFKQKFANDLNNIIPIIEIKNLYYTEFYYGRKFKFLVILFSYKGNLRRTELKKKIIEIYKVIDQYPEIVRIDRYFSRVFFNQSMEKNLINSIENQSLSVNLKKYNLPKNFNVRTHYWSRLIEGKPFIIEISNFFPLNINLEVIIRDYFSSNFPKLIELIEKPQKFLAFLDGKFNISNFRKIREDENNIEGIIHKKIHRELWDKVGTMYDRLGSIYLYNFYEWLSKSYRIYQNYDQKTLENLKNYLEELRYSYYTYPDIFISDFDYIGLKLCRKDYLNKITFEKNTIYDRYNKNYPGFFDIARDFLEIYFKLRDQIEENLTKINFLILNKKDLIKSFNKSELANKLLNLKEEKIFRQNILMPILKDLGYEDIQEIHGQHEYGIDILFRNKNKFGIIEWNGIVAKLGDINLENGTELSKNLKRIFNQLYQAKKMLHTEINYGDVKITRVFIVTNGNFNFYAKMALLKKDPLIEGNIFFIDRDLLLSLF